MSKKSQIYPFLAIFVVVLAFLPWIGAEKLEIREIWAFMAGEWTADGMIFFQIRLPRVLMGLLAGGALAMAGAALQVMFRNPLAEPWTLGIAGGASLGAFLARVCPFLWFALGPLNTSQLLALAGAGGALALVLSLSRRPGGAGAQTLLLAGLTIGVISGGAIMVVSGFISPWKLAEFHRWLLGGLDAADWSSIGALAALAVQKLRGNGGLLGKTRTIQHYDFVHNRPVGAPIAPGSVPRNTINWVVPPFGYGSGGHLNIFRFAQFLEKEGFDCRIVVVGEPQPLSAEQARKQIRDWFFPLKGDVYLGKRRTSH